MMLLLVLLLATCTIARSSDDGLITVECLDGIITIPKKITCELYELKTKSILQHSKMIKKQLHDLGNSNEVSLPILKKEFEIIFPLMQLIEVGRYNFPLSERKAQELVSDDLNDLSKLAGIASILDVYNLQNYAVCLFAHNFDARMSTFLKDPESMRRLFFSRSDGGRCDKEGSSQRWLNPDLCSDLANLIAQGSSFKKHFFDKKIIKNSYFWGDLPHETKLSNQCALWHSQNLFGVVDMARNKISCISPDTKTINLSVHSNLGKITSVACFEKTKLLYTTDQGYLGEVDQFEVNFAFEHPISLLVTAANKSKMLLHSRQNNSIKFVERTEQNTFKVVKQLAIPTRTYVGDISMSADATHYIMVSNTAGSPRVGQVGIYSCADYCEKYRFEVLSCPRTVIAHNPVHDERYLMTYRNNRVITLASIGAGINMTMYQRECDKIKKLVWSPLGNMFASIESDEGKDTLFFWDPRMHTYAHKINPGINLKNFNWDRDAKYGVFFGSLAEGVRGMHCLDMSMLSENLGSQPAYLDQLLSVRSLDTALLLEGVAHALDKNEKIVFFNADSQAIYNSMTQDAKQLIRDTVSVIALK